MIAVGVDVAEEGKGLDLVALDGSGRIVESAGRLTVGQASALILDGIGPDVVCIDSPSGWSRTGRSRQGERDLARMGISAFATGQDPGDHPFYRWMRVGFAVFGSVATRYPLFRGDGPEGRAAEVFPNASAVLLAGRRRQPGETKLRFRRAVLGAHGIPQTLLPNVDRVDAALAALTGLWALGGRWTAVGDPEEGMILLPVAHRDLRPANGQSG